MEYVKEREILSGFRVVENSAKYVKFWQDKNTIELINDVLFGITRYLGNICLYLNKAIRRMYIGIIGFNIDYRDIEKLPKNIIEYVKKITIIPNDNPDSSNYIYGQLNTIGGLVFRNSYLDLLDRDLYTEQIIRFTNLEVIDEYMIDFAFRADEYHDQLVKFIDQILSGGKIKKYRLLLDTNSSLYTFKNNILPRINANIRDKILIVEEFSNIIFNCNDYISCGLAKEKYMSYALIRYDILYERYKSTEKTLVIHYHPVLLDYIDNVLVPAYKDMGRNLKVLIFGEQLLPIDYNPSICTPDVGHTRGNNIQEDIDMHTMMYEQISDIRDNDYIKNYLDQTITEEQETEYFVSEDIKIEDMEDINQASMLD